MHHEITLEFKEFRRRQKGKEAMHLKDNMKAVGNRLDLKANCNN